MRGYRGGGNEVKHTHTHTHTQLLHATGRLLQLRGTRMREKRTRVTTEK